MRYRLRTVLLFLVCTLVTNGCGNLNNFGTIHRPAQSCTSGKALPLELAIAMHGWWPGGRRSHVGDIKCFHRFSTDLPFEGKVMEFKQETDGRLYYTCSIDVPSEASGKVAEYYFEFMVDGKLHNLSRGEPFTIAVAPEQTP